MTVPRPLGTPHWEALKGYMPYSLHRPRNRSDKVRRRGIRDESDQLRSSREPVVGSDCGPWACVLPSVAGPPRADSHSLLPGTWGRLQPPPSPLTTPSPALASSGQQIVGRSDTTHFQTRAHSLPCCINHGHMCYGDTTRWRSLEG